MKIVDRGTFMSLPDGTMFCNYVPDCLEVPEIRGHVVPDNDKYLGDFEVTALVDVMTDREQEDGTRGMDYDFTTRAGCNDPKQLFAVWEKKDIQGLIRQLQKALHVAPGELPEQLEVSLSSIERNVFEHQCFKDLWPDREGAPEKDLLQWLENPGNELKFCIIVKNSVVGITGLWEMGGGRLGLAWHGILPQYRNKGYSSQAIRKLIENAQVWYPDATTIVEAIPEAREQELGKHYQGLGFVRTGDKVVHPEMYDGVTWIEYIYNLKPNTL